MRIAVNSHLASLAVAIFLSNSAISLAAGESINQAPKGQSMHLKDFLPQLMDTPFDIKYPESWYVREEYYGQGRAATYFTREKIERPEDVYVVGAYVMGLANKYSRDASFEVKVAIVLQDIQKQMKILKAKEIKIGNNRATKIWIETDSKKGITIIFPIKKNLYLVASDAPTAEFDKYENDLENIVDSFKWRRSFIKAQNPPKQVDPVMKAFITNSRVDATVNGEKREKVHLGDVVKEFMQK